MTKRPETIRELIEYLQTRDPDEKVHYWAVEQVENGTGHFAKWPATEEQPNG